MGKDSRAYEQSVDSPGSEGRSLPHHVGANNRCASTRYLHKDTNQGSTSSSTVATLGHGREDTEWPL